MYVICLTAESFCSSELSLDDSNGLEALDDSGPELHNLENHPSTHHHSGSSELLPSYNQINPIDKLYLMQNSYFTDP
jgi:LIM homeobox transcription factor 1